MVNLGMDCAKLRSMVEVAKVDCSAARELWVLVAGVRAKRAD